MIESRCGIQCSKCEYKEKASCPTCIKIEKPFWSSEHGCPLKNCCEEKGLAHCGQCHVFPCETLVDFAYEKEQGDNGMRIERCRCWNQNEK